MAPGQRAHGPRFDESISHAPLAMSRITGAALVSVDGVDAAAVKAAAKRLLSTRSPRGRSGISQWGASGLFDELAIAGDSAGIPSARTLLLLYASDLAFRLRWQIEPALAEGQLVVAAPYVDTAVAFGRAAGLPAGWLASLFRFAASPTSRCYVEEPPVRSPQPLPGFIELGCARLAGRHLGLSSQQLASRTRAHLNAAAVRRGRSAFHAGQ